MFHKSCWRASWKIAGLGWNNSIKDFSFIAFELLALSFIHICMFHADTNNRKIYFDLLDFN